jgi:predicted transcriptional regulator
VEGLNMKEIVYDTSESGFHAVLRDWQIKAMQAIWNNPEGVNSRMAWQKVNQTLEGETISRASIINFLEDMREMGVLTGEEKTGKGGHHWVYFPAMDESGFKQFIVKKMIDSLMESFPDEAREAIRK